MRRFRCLSVLCVLSWLLACGAGGSGPGEAVAVAVAPATAALQTGQSQAFTATVTGTANTAVTWSVLEAGGGSVSAAGLYTAPATAGTFHVRATSVADPTKSAQATVTATQPAPVIASFTASPATLTAGQSSTLNWSVSGASSLSLDQGIGPVSGTSLAVTPAATTTYTLTASNAGGSVSATATVTVHPAPVVAVSVNPPTVALQAGQSQAFTATVTGTANTAVTWSVLEAGGGSVSATGLYTAPGAPGTFHVRATSVADPGKSAQATVTVTVPLPVIASFTASPATLTAGQSSTLNWSVSGATGLSLAPGIGTVTGSSLAVSPAATTTYTLTATNTSGSVTATVTVTVNPAPVVAVSVYPPTVTLQAGQSQAFTAAVTGTANTAVTWSVLEAGGGSLDGGGLYTAPATTGSYHVQATSVADPSRSAQATVTVTLPLPVIASFTASPATITAGAGSTLNWSVSGAASLSIDPGIGAVTGSSLVVTPAATTTYTLTASNAGGSSSVSATVTVNTAPSLFLHFTSARLAQVRADALAGKPAWQVLHQNVEANLTSDDVYDIGPENLALAYLVSGDGRYAARAYWWAQQYMAANLRRDSYYDYGELMEGVALVLNYCAPALDPSQAAALADYLEASTDELWYHNQGSGWGLDNPRNNYHHNFLMGTAYAGYALRARGDARGDRWIAKVGDLMENPAGVLAYLNNGVPGGDWEEGVNYAEGSKMHLARALSLVVAAGGTDYFRASPFFANFGRFALYALQPGGRFLYPGGDLARDSSMGLCPYERALLQPVVMWLPDAEGRRLGQWFLNHAMPTYLDGDHSFSYRTGLWMDVAFAVDGSETAPSTLPLSYRTPVTNWVNLRSGWDAQATSLTISGAPRVVESHQHMDTGSFTLWKGDWQAVDASTYSHSGLLMEATAHNLLRVPHAQWTTDEDVQVPGLRRFGDLGALAYAQVDSTRLYRWIVSSEDRRDLLDEHTREFVYLRPNTLVLFDRVAAKPDGMGYAWCLHVPVSPAAVAGGHATSYRGAGLSLAKLLGGATTVVSDADLEPGTTSSRIEEAATGAVSRFLNVVEVGAPAAPAITAQLLASSPGVRGAFVHGTAVVFSDAARGAPAALPFSYTVPGTATATHVLCNLGGPVSVTTARVSGNTLVTVSAGSTQVPDSNGVVVLNLTPP